LQIWQEFSNFAVPKAGKSGSSGPLRSSGAEMHEATKTGKLTNGQNQQTGKQPQNNMELKVIAYARNGHTDKFGIPRQSRDESPILTRIVFEPEYNVAEALRGIEGYSHLWILWGFSEVQRENVRCTKEWSPTVRPPRLGGNKRMGVFATRSPFRPNPIGLSSVKLIGVRYSDKSTNRHVDISKFNDDADKKEGRMELLVSGADVLDGTPIYDIKPYLSFSDSHEDAQNGFAEATKEYYLEVRSTKASLVAEWGVPEQVAEDILYILKQDPRPGYQDDPEREYKMDYAGWRVVFSVDAQSEVLVHRVSKISQQALFR